MKYLLGDSHLARLTTNELPELDSSWINYARDGAMAADTVATVLDLPEFLPGDIVVISVGTNDAAPWNRVPVSAFEQHLDQLFRAVVPAEAFYLVPPGVDERRLAGANDRTNAGMARWFEAAIASAQDHAVRTIDLYGALRASGVDPFCEDGVHLSEAGNALLVALLRTAEAAA